MCAVIMDRIYRGRLSPQQPKNGNCTFYIHIGARPEKGHRMPTRLLHTIPELVKKKNNSELKCEYDPVVLTYGFIHQKSPDFTADKD